MYDRCKECNQFDNLSDGGCCHDCDPDGLFDCPGCGAPTDDCECDDR